MLQLATRALLSLEAESSNLFCYHHLFLTENSSNFCFHHVLFLLDPAIFFAYTMTMTGSNTATGGRQ